MKRTCKGCRALTEGFPLTSCDLGFEIKYYGDELHVLYKDRYYYPVEECPKPKTWKKYEVCIKKQLGKLPKYV